MKTSTNTNDKGKKNMETNEKKNSLNCLNNEEVHRKMKQELIHTVCIVG